MMVEQGAGSDSGLVGLVTLLRYHGIGVDAEQIRHRFSTGTTTQIDDMLRCAKALGLKARCFTSNWERSALEDINHLQRLAEDLLVLARSRGGQIPIRRVRTRLDALVGKCLQVVNAQSHDAGVTIDVDRSDDTVELDPDRVQQALRNILENAVRHSPRGGVVRLSAGRTNGTVRFVVAGDRAWPGDCPRRGAAHGGSAFAENTPTGARVTLELQT